MATTDPLLVVLKTLLLVGESIRLTKLALDNNPPPDLDLELHDRSSDLQMLKDELIALADALENAQIETPPPPAELFDAAAVLVKQVEEERLAGAAAVQTVALAAQAIDVAVQVMSAAVQVKA
jgi:hypothetical protein